MFYSRLTVLFLLLAAGCAIRKDMPTPFKNLVNKPIISDSSDRTSGGTKYCVPKADGSFDDSSVKLTSGLDEDGSAWAEGGGCVLRPIRETWAVLNNLELMKFEGADSFSATRATNPRPDFTHRYEITYKRATPAVSLWWKIDWYHGVGRGTFAAPEQINIRYQRVKGTPFIPVWSGGLVITKVTETVTSIAIRSVFEAEQSDSENEGSARDVLNEMIEKARRGSPDWNRLNQGIKDNPPHS